MQPEDVATQQGNPPAIERQIYDFVKSVHLLPKDAWIVAEADRLGVYDIATLDADFLRLDSAFTIYTIP